MRRNEEPSELSFWPVDASLPSVDDDSEQVATMYGPSPKIDAEQLDATTWAIVKLAEHVVSDPAYETVPSAPSMQRSATYIEEEER